MKIINILLIVLNLFLFGEALKCMTCYGSRSHEECSVNGHVQKCMANQNTCETVVRRNKENQFVVKRCKEETACKNNQLQNLKKSGVSTQCNSDQSNSFCTCCCSSDMCNVNVASCLPIMLQTETGTSCSAQPNLLPHGNIQCFGENQPGSVCEYQCTGVDYFVFPVGHETNVCQNNGVWKHKTPCCARPCPPYFLFDFVDLLHINRPDGREFLITMIENFLEIDAFAEDAVKASIGYFSGKPLESSMVRFNEYQSNKTEFLRLFKERFFPVNEGPVNIGAAIQYALDNLLTAKAGMRDERVPKMISIITDRNSDDDAVGAALEAKRRGFLVHVIGIEGKGVTLDRKTFLEMTGNEDMVVMYDADTNTFKSDALPVIIDHFCRDPCDHVLHKH